MCPYPDNFNGAACDLATTGDPDRNYYNRQKFDEARQTLATAWAALVAARNAWAGVYELHHEYETGMSYDPADFGGHIQWEMKTIGELAQRYGVVLEGVV